MKEENNLVKKDLALAFVFILFSALSLLFAVRLSNADETWVAETIAYNNKTSNLKSNNIKDALDEINSMIDGNEYTAKNGVECTGYTDGCKKPTENPKTGDKNMLIICLLIGVSTTSLIVAAIILSKSKTKKEEKEKK